MNGTLALAMAEISRIRRNRRYMIFTVALPVLLYLIFGKQGKGASADGIPFSTWYMVAMATFGAVSGAFNNNAIRISQERKGGWIRQLRLTPLPAYSYMVAKVVASMVTSIPAIAIVLILGSAYGSVSLPIWVFIVIAVAIWLGTLIFAALAVAVGYRVEPDSAQPIVMIVFMVFTILGGVWFPLSGAMGNIAKFTPAYQVVKISRDVIKTHSFAAINVAGVFIWLAIFAALAIFTVRSTAETV
jgi:ABC-2 type transport system permease protein